MVGEGGGSGAGSPYTSSSSPSAESLCCVAGCWLCACCWAELWENFAEILENHEFRRGDEAVWPLDLSTEFARLFRLPVAVPLAATDEPVVPCASPFVLLSADVGTDGAFLIWCDGGDGFRFILSLGEDCVIQLTSTPWTCSMVDDIVGSKLGVCYRQR